MHTTNNKQQGSFMNHKFLIAMLYSGVFSLFAGAFGFLWASSILGSFIVGTGSANLNNANLNIPAWPLITLVVVGFLLIIISIKLASKDKTSNT
jgi:hypothetical protein